MVREECGKQREEQGEHGRKWKRKSRERENIVREDNDEFLTLSTSSSFTSE